MKTFIGIFLNNTDSELKYKINISNYNKLKNNFDVIIIIDIDNEYSNKLKNNLFNNDKKIIYYILDNQYINDYKEEIIIALKKIVNINYDYATFINDKYIYLNDLKDYFNYVIEKNIEFCPYADSSEIFYHYELYLFTIDIKKVDVFLNHILNNDLDNSSNLNNIFNSILPYLKCAYIKNNINTNIFYNDKIYNKLLDNNILPILSLENLYYRINIYEYDYNASDYKEIPEHFDINIYKKNKDLENLPESFLLNHFIKYGQYEHRKFSKKNNYINYILTNSIRNKLKEIDLLYKFDVPDDFNVYNHMKKEGSEKNTILEFIGHKLEEEYENYKL
jgi:hypothetical protein